jgi:hypothetical protein
MTRIGYPAACTKVGGLGVKRWLALLLVIPLTFCTAAADARRPAVARTTRFTLRETKKYRSCTVQQKLVIVLAGLRGDRSVAEVCRVEGGAWGVRIETGI